MKIPKTIETAYRQIDRRAKWYGMTRKEYLQAFFTRFNRHDDLKTELAIQRLMIEERNNLPFLEA